MSAASIADAAAELVDLGDPIEPRPELRDTYEEAYQRYRDVYFALEGVLT
jgi:sugar (pentulose or hexulose) kinase